MSMSLEKNKAIIRRLIEAFNKQDLSIMEDLAASDFVDHTRQLRGWETMKQFLIMLYKHFPDYHATIEDIIAEGNKVWVLEKCTMTHTVEYRGIAPTGKKITETFVEIYHIIDGKIVESWAVEDSMDFYKQLGAIEYKGFPEDVK